jgi:hypothetical protein
VASIWVVETPLTAGWRGIDGAWMSRALQLPRWKCAGRGVSPAPLRRSSTAIRPPPSSVRVAVPATPESPSLAMFTVAVRPCAATEARGATAAGGRKAAARASNGAITISRSRFIVSSDPRPSPAPSKPSAPSLLPAAVVPAARPAPPARRVRRGAVPVPWLSAPR